MTNTSALKTAIETAWETRDNAAAFDAATRAAIEDAVAHLGSGELRVAEPAASGWQVNEWLKKAVLLYFRLHPNRVMDGGPMSAFDKVPLRFLDADKKQFNEAGMRVVPGALVRRGAHVGKDAVLMPSYVNIGAYVGAGSMVDTW
ncbi:MAG: 2,3,4,5-tetrahydropyridine-2,6-dicarboxylate N-succinyltransferase, partial [Sinobacteraceae bacterium]|nr:2,3,4,5-tetrahydropyridine-2,6-dicarboxylate N-succinyltransferase [Nevskiaceae bacterium]